MVCKARDQSVPASAESSSTDSPHARLTAVVVAQPAAGHAVVDKHLRAAVITTIPVVPSVINCQGVPVWAESAAHCLLLLLLLLLLRVLLQLRQLLQAGSTEQNDRGSSIRGFTPLPTLCICVVGVPLPVFPPSLVPFVPQLLSFLFCFVEKKLSLLLCPPLAPSKITIWRRQRGTQTNL